MTERHLHDDPPTAEQVAAARADIAAGVRQAGRDGAARRGAHPRRPGRLGHHGGGNGAGPAGVRPEPDPPRAHPGCRRSPGRGPPAGDDRTRARGAAVHASRPGRRDRRRRPGARGRCSSACRSTTSWSASTTSSTASPGPSWFRDAPVLAAARPAADTGDLVLTPLTEADLDEVAAALPADLELNPSAPAIGLPDDEPARRRRAPGVLAVLRHLDPAGMAVPPHRTARTASCSGCRSSRATTSRPCAPWTLRPGWSPARRGPASARRCAARCWPWRSTTSARSRRSPRPGTTTTASLGVSRSLGYRPNGESLDGP